MRAAAICEAVLKASLARLSNDLPPDERRPAVTTRTAQAGFDFLVADKCRIVARFDRATNTSVGSALPFGGSVSR